MSDRPDDVDAAFAEIVADLQREGVGRTIPDLDDLTDTSELPVTDDPDGTPPSGNPAPGGLGHGPRGPSGAGGHSGASGPGGASGSGGASGLSGPGGASGLSGASGQGGASGSGGPGMGNGPGLGNAPGLGGLSPGLGPGRIGKTPREPAERPRSSEPPPAWRGHDAEWDWSWGTDEDHYVPPEPPPLPKLRPLTILALVLVVLGVILLIIPSLIGLDARIATPIALLSITCGGGMLLLRVRQNPKDPGTRDDGAQI